MRMFRRLTLGLTVLSFVPAVASAQSGSRFTDSWFWGVKGGNMTFWTPRVKHAQAPLIGAEWLITRTRGALYVSVDQAFFDERSSLNGAAIGIENNRRLTVALFAFPKEIGMIRPYGGLGIATNFIQNVDLRGSGQSPDTVAVRTTNVFPMMTAGLQFQMRRLSLFAQGSVMWANNNFLINDETYFLEGGIRYNVGRAQAQ